MSGAVIGKGSLDISVAEAEGMNENDNYLIYVKPLIEEMLHVLDCDLQHKSGNGGIVFSIDSLLACEYYSNNLSCLDGRRNEAVSLMNSKLREYNVPEHYRFN